MKSVFTSGLESCEMTWNELKLIQHSFSGKSLSVTPFRIYCVFKTDKATFYFFIASTFSTKTSSTASSQDSSGFSWYNLAFGGENRGFPRLLSIITLPCRADSGERAR